MKSEDIIIGEAVLFLLNSMPRHEFSKEILVEHLTRLYVQKYETSADIAEIERYLSAIETITFKRLT